MLDQAKLAISDIKLALEKSAEFFIHFFLGSEITAGVPKFHIEIFILMVHATVSKLSLAIPRAHAKTSLAKLAAVYYIIFTRYSYILYVSSIKDISIPNVVDIASYFESENFEAVFGPVEFHVRQEGKGYYEFTLPPSLGSKRVILKAFGAFNNVRGTLIRKRRPQLMIIDDIESSENIETDALFTKLKRWIYGPLKKCVDTRLNKTIWLGNMVQSRSMLYENTQSKFWFSRLYGCLLEDGTPLWPEMWTVEALQADFEEYAEAGMIDIWFAEMMNMPIGVGNGVIEASEINYLPEVAPGDYKVGFLTIDLASSAQDWGHNTVVAAHAWIEDRETWQIVETRSYKGMNPVTLFPQVISMSQYWGFYFVGIESVQYQATVVPVFEHYAMLENIQGMRFMPVPARIAKTTRIIIWAGMLKAKTYALTEGDYGNTQQLLTYDPKKKENIDDEIDACAHGPYVIKHYLFEVHKTAQDHEAKTETYEAEAQSSVEVCRY